MNDHGQFPLHRLSPADAPGVAALHRSAVPEGELDMTVFGSARLEAYLGALMAFPEYRREHVFSGAFRGGELVGYAHSRSLPGRWHLNYVVVHPSCQGEGVGRRLWESWLRTGRELAAPVVSLDVLPSNRRAAEWYRRRGLSDVSTTWMCYANDAAGPGPAAVPEAVSLAGWEDAEAWQQAYGFSRFRVEHGGSVWDVGRLPRRYFTVAADFPKKLSGVLRSLDPERQVLFTTHREEQTRGFRVARVSVRMEAPLSQVA